MERFLRAAEVASLLGIALVTLDKMIRENRFPKPDFGGGMGSTRRWKQSTYENWCNQGCKDGSKIAS